MSFPKKGGRAPLIGIHNPEPAPSFMAYDVSQPAIMKKHEVQTVG